MKHSEYALLLEAINEIHVGPGRTRITSYDDISSTVVPLLTAFTPQWEVPEIVVLPQQDFTRAAEDATQRIAHFIHTTFLPQDLKEHISASQYVEALMESNPVTKTSIVHKGLGFADPTRNIAFVLEQQPDTAIVTAIEEACHLYLHDAHSTGHRYLMDPSHHNALKLLHTYNACNESDGIVSRILKPSKATKQHYGETQEQRTRVLGGTFGTLLHQYKAKLKSPEHHTSLELYVAKDAKDRFNLP